MLITSKVMIGSVKAELIDYKIPKDSSKTETDIRNTALVNITLSELEVLGN